MRIEPYKDRAEWLELRRSGIGSSDMAAVLGESPYSTPFQVWASKVGELDIVDVASEAMLWGQRLESLVLRETVAQNWPNATLVEQPFVRHATLPWAVATPDAIATPKAPDSERFLVEVKTTHEYAWDEVPRHIWLQVQWQLEVTGLSDAYLAVLHRGRHLDVTLIEAVPGAAEYMRIAAQGFWEDYVEGDTPPPIEADDSGFLSQLYPKHSEIAIEISPTLIERVRVARAAYSDAKAAKDAAEAELKLEMGEADTAVVGQSVVATWRTHDRAGYHVAPKAIRTLRVKDP